MRGLRREAERSEVKRDRRLSEMLCRHFCMCAVRGRVSVCPAEHLAGSASRFRGLSGRFDRGPSARFVSLNVRVSRGRSGGAQLACTIATNPEPDTTHQTSKYRNLSLTVVATATASLLRSLVLYHRGQRGRLCWRADGCVGIDFLPPVASVTVDPCQPGRWSSLSQQRYSLGQQRHQSVSVFQPCGVIKL